MAIPHLSHASSFFCCCRSKNTQHVNTEAFVSVQFQHPERQERLWHHSCIALTISQGFLSLKPKQVTPTELAILLVNKEVRS
jgi:hypothetical protein